LGEGEGGVGYRCDERERVYGWEWLRIVFVGGVWGILTIVKRKKWMMCVLCFVILKPLLPISFSFPLLQLYNPQL
jgi:hypothetical protein